MHFELELIRNAPTTDAAELSNDKSQRPVESTIRREVRQATDHVMREADTLSALLSGCCVTMLAVARGLERCAQEPSIGDFREASVALIEDARAVFDRGVMVDDMETMRCGAVMMELVMRGMFAALGQDYEASMRAVHEGREPPVRKPNEGEDDGSEKQTIGTDGRAGADSGTAVRDTRDRA